MPFMLPVYENGDFVTFDHDGEGEIIPLEHFDCCDWPGTISDVETVVGMWWARLSAPGYMDCTEWGGPFETLDEAKAYIEETFEVDPETGETIDYAS